MSRSPGTATTNAVDPASAPLRVRSNGDTPPAVAMGTFGSDRYGTAQVAAADTDAGDPLTEQETTALSGADQGDRLIEGQVFLWPGARSWEELWDLDRVVATWDEVGPHEKMAP